VFRAAALVLWCAAAFAASGGEPVHDPMRPFAAGAAGAGGPAAAAAPRFVLTAVLISSARRVAIINGKPYRQGDKVAGAEITRIESQAVALDDGGEELVVHLGKTRASATAATGDSPQ
jgi:hypothetical protein